MTRKRSGVRSTHRPRTAETLGGVSAERDASLMRHRTKRVLGWAAFLVFVTAGLALAWNFHQAANAAPVTAIWQQPTVTVDDREVAALAQSWQAPFEVVYAAQGADITVRRGVALEPMTGGLATRDEDGDRTEGCTLDLRADASEFVMVHEVGHCLGYAGHSHAGKGVSVMAQYGWDASPVVTDADRAELAALYAGGAR